MRRVLCWWCRRDLTSGGFDLYRALGRLVPSCKPGHGCNPSAGGGRDA